MKARIQFMNLPGPGSGGLPAGRPLGPVGRALAMIAGGVILVAGLFFSVIVFSVLLAVGLVAGGWFWWKTRGLRADMREQVARMQEAAQAGNGAFGGGARARSGGAGSSGREAGNGEVIDGDFIREADPSRARTRSTDRPRPPQG